MVIIVIIQYWFVCLFFFQQYSFIHSFINVHHFCYIILLISKIFFLWCCWFVHKHNLFSNFLIHNLFRLMNEWMNEYIWKRDRFPVVFFHKFQLIILFSFHDLFIHYSGIFSCLCIIAKLNELEFFFSLWWISHQIMALFGAILCYLCVCMFFFDSFLMGS